MLKNGADINKDIFDAVDLSSKINDTEKNELRSLLKTYSQYNQKIESENKSSESESESLQKENHIIFEDTKKEIELNLSIPIVNEPPPNNEVILKLEEKPHNSSQNSVDLKRESSEDLIQKSDNVSIDKNLPADALISSEENREFDLENEKKSDNLTPLNLSEKLPAYNKIDNHEVDLKNIKITPESKLELHEFSEAKLSNSRDKSLFLSTT